jgi:hypothetical protein
VSDYRKLNVDAERAARQLRAFLDHLVAVEVAGLDVEYRQLCEQEQ